MNFGQVARVAKSHDEFVSLCEGEVAKPSRARIVRGLKLAETNTWEAIISRMERHIADVLKPARKAKAKAAARAGAESPGPFADLAYV